MKGLENKNHSKSKQATECIKMLKAYKYRWNEVAKIDTAEEKNIKEEIRILENAILLLEEFQDNEE